MVVFSWPNFCLCLIPCQNCTSKQAQTHKYAHTLASQWTDSLASQLERDSQREPKRGANWLCDMHSNVYPKSSPWQLVTAMPMSRTDMTWGWGGTNLGRAYTLSEGTGLRPIFRITERIKGHTLLEWWFQQAFSYISRGEIKMTAREEMTGCNHSGPATWMPRAPKV